MEKILVTGAGGYIGTHVVNTLLDMNCHVIAADIVNNGIDRRAEFIACDIFSDETDLYDKLGRPDRLIHLAWRDGFIHNSPTHLEFLSKHYGFIKNMTESGVKSVSVMGSMHEIGYYEGAIDETTPSNPRSLYGISKNALRQAVALLAETGGFSLKWLRGFYICGDDIRNNSIFAKILRTAAEGKTEFPFTTGVNQYDFISIDHLALQISLAAVQDKIDGIINCCSGKPVALKDKVEQFIIDHHLNIKLQYGVFPDRAYDSKIIYGNSDKILDIMQSSANRYGSVIAQRISGLIEEMN